MKTKSLRSVERELAERRARTSSVVVPAETIRLTESAGMIVEGQSLNLGADAQAQLARLASIPPEFFARCDPDIRAMLFNRLYPESQEWRRPFGDHVALILRDGSRVTGMTNASLAQLTGYEVLAAALAARPQDLNEDGLEIADFHLDGDMRVSIVSRQIETEPRVGDIVRAGLDIQHDDAGRSGTKVESYLLRLACLNGMVVKICTHASTSGYRIRRAASGNRNLTIDRIKEMASTAWSELSDKLVAVNMLATERVDNSADFIRSIGEKLRFSERMIMQIISTLDADELGQSGTLWDVVCALSRIGTHSDHLSSATRRYLRELSGDLIRERVERCATCGAIRRGRMRLLPRR